MKRKLPLYAALLLLTQCSQCKKEDPAPADPVDQLPPATQTGANTFGCLVNGQAYTPQGRVGLGSNFAVSYDPTFNGGNLIIRTYSYGLSGNSPKKTLAIGGDSINHTGIYQLTPTSKQTVVFLDRNRQIPCDGIASDDGYANGNLTITRLDLRAGIVSGTFAFKMVKPGCDTIRITQGRFDAKL